MQKRDRIALGIFAIFYIAIGISLTLFQNIVVYHPNNQDFASCENFAEAEKVTMNGTRMICTRYEETSSGALSWKCRFSL